MGKKSLLKSTSKKKNVKAKPDSDKEIAPTGKTREAKAAPKKAKGSKKQSTGKAMPAETQPAEAKKADVKKAKPLSIKELVLLKFDTPKPDTLFSVKVDDSARKNIMAPPFVSGLDPAETERVRQLLFKTFDLSAPEPAPEVVAVVEPVMEKAPAPPAVPVSIAELLKLKFDIAVPATLYVPPVTATGIAVESPPFVSGLDPAETERVRQLLFKTFDLSVPDPIPAEPEPVVAAVAEKAPEPEVTAPEIQAVTAEPEVKIAEPAPEAEAAAPAPEVEVVPTIETPVSAQRPLPIGIDFPEPPMVPTMSVPDVSPIAAQAASSEPGKNGCAFFKALDPLIKKAIYAGCGLAAVFLLICIISFSNMSKYYLVAKGGTVEVRQGRFAPLGTDQIAVLTDARLQKKTKSALTRGDVGPLIIENYVSRADDLMVTKGVPDFEEIRTLLKEALSYAEAKDVRESILERLNRIDMTALVFKATISAGKESRSDLEAARDYLTKAGWLAKEKSEMEMIQQKLKVVNDKLSVPPPLKQAPPSKSPPPSAAPAAHH